MDNNYFRGEYFTISAQSVFNLVHKVNLRGVELITIIQTPEHETDKYTAVVREKVSRIAIDEVEEC